MSVITISRQFGAGGKTLGEKVSAQLGYEFFDNELIQLTSIKAKVSADSVDALEKESHGVFRSFLSGVVPRNLRDILLERSSKDIEEDVYVDLLSQIITEIANDGNAVIIGRGSQYTLKNRKDTLHVLVAGQIADRIEFIRNKYNLLQHQAVEAVARDDRRRANLYHKFGITDYDSPHNYHLVLNMSKVDMETACELVLELANS